MIRDYGPRFLPFYKKGYRWQTIPSLLTIFFVAIANSNKGEFAYVLTLFIGWLLITILWIFCYDLFMSNINKLQVKKFYLSVFLTQSIFILGCLIYVGVFKI